MNHRPQAWRIVLLAVPYFSLLCAASVLFAFIIAGNPETTVDKLDGWWVIAAVAASLASMAYAHQIRHARRRRSANWGLLIISQIGLSWVIVVTAACAGILIYGSFDRPVQLNLGNLYGFLLITLIWGQAAWPFCIVVGFVNSILVAAAIRSSASAV